MKKILYPTDATTASKNAFLYALNIAKAYQAKVIAFHFYENSTEEFRNASDTLNSEAKRLGFDEIQIEHIAKNSENRSVESVAKREKVDVVVIASKGTESSEPVMVGALLSEVVVQSKTLVLIVPENKKFSEGINNITFTTRFRDKDKKALDKCLEFASITNAKVDCLYVKTSNSDISDSKINEWKELYSDKNIDFHIIESNDVNKAILNFIEVFNSDLMAILTYKRTFIEELFRGSTAQQLSYYSSVPLLVIHESDL